MGNNNWYKVDNVAKVFLATYNKRDTRSLRVCCTLKEMIDKDILQEALMETINARPIFQVSIRRGIFWHYMEETDQIPQVREESLRPCPLLYEPGRKNDLHYRVTYFQNRINLDVFHAISDGTGALDFLNLLVLNYLRRMNPGQLDHIVNTSGASSDEQMQDSFHQFFDKKDSILKVNLDKLVEVPEKAYHPSGLKLPYNQLQFFELHLDAAQVLSKAKEFSVSPSSYIGARLMMAIKEDMPSVKKQSPVVISMPVNLRNYYPSNTLRNFFNNVNISHTFQDDITLENLSQEFNRQLKEQITPENIMAQMDRYESMERIFPIRMTPLFIKQLTVRSGTKLQDQKVSAVLSNLGIQKQPPELEKHIENYSAFCSSQNLFMTISSYQNKMTLGITSPYYKTVVLKNFVRGLTTDGFEVEAFATEVIY